MFDMTKPLPNHKQVKGEVNCNLPIYQPHIRKMEKNKVTKKKILLM